MVLPIRFGWILDPSLHKYLVIRWCECQSMNMSTLAGALNFSMPKKFLKKIWSFLEHLNYGSFNKKSLLIQALTTFLFLQAQEKWLLVFQRKVISLSTFCPVLVFLGFVHQLKKWKGIQCSRAVYKALFILDQEVMGSNLSIQKFSLRKLGTFALLELPALLWELIF